MIIKFLTWWMNIGQEILDEYTKLSVKMALALMIPYYVLFAIPYCIVMALAMLIFMVQCRLEGSLTFKESFAAFKEGVEIGVDQLQYVEFGREES